jgi:4-hydroxybenzoate polyprenyltransferase
MIADIWKTMRPNHWLKNVFILAPLFFSGSVTDIEKVELTALAFVAFCLMSSAVYFLNDVLDRERDKITSCKVSPANRLGNNQYSTSEQYCINLL